MIKFATLIRQKAKYEERKYAYGSFVHLVHFFSKSPCYNKHNIIDGGTK